MLSQEQLIELYGGLPQEKTVRVQGFEWWIETPTIKVEGDREIDILIQGGIHSEYAQLSHKVRRFAIEGFPVVCLSQSGAAKTRKSPNFYDGDYSHFVTRDLATLDTFGVKKTIAYGSSLGAGAAIALAAGAPERVAAVIAVNPASLVKQLSIAVAVNFLRASLDRVDKDFTPPPTTPPSLWSATKEELFGKANNLAASDVGLDYLSRVQCPVLIYTGKQDKAFSWQRLLELQERFPTVQVIPVDSFVHSDPNSRAKINWLVTDALGKLQKLGVI